MTQGPHVAPQGGVVQTVEPVAVGDRDVHVRLQQQLHHVVTLLGDGVVEGCVSLRVLCLDITIACMPNMDKNSALFSWWFQQKYYPFLEKKFH